MTLDEFYEVVISLHLKFGDISRALSHHEDEQVRQINDVTLGDWAALASLASFQNRASEHFLVEPQKSKLSNDEAAACELERKVSNEIVQYFLDRISRERMPPTAASMLIQMHVEAKFAQGKGGPKITVLSPAAAEKDSVLMLDRKFAHSNPDVEEISTAPANPESPPPHPALLTHKHNACPYVVGVDTTGETAAAWHISHSSIFKDQGPQQVAKPANMPNSDMQFLVLGLTPTQASAYLPEGINRAKVVELPSDIFLEKIATFRPAGTFTFSSSGGFSSDEHADTEPASYDSTYYPKSDTLILWGQNTDGLPCAWFMKDAVRSEEQQAWQKVVLGTKEEPLLYWHNFLKEHFNYNGISKIGAADKIIQAFADSPEQKDLLVVNTRLV